MRRNISIMTSNDLKRDRGLLTSPSAPLRPQPPAELSESNVRTIDLVRAQSESTWGITFQKDTVPLTVTSVRPASAAFRSGLREGDEVLAVNGAVPSSCDAGVSMFRSSSLKLVTRRVSLTQSASPPPAPAPTPPPRALPLPPALASALSGNQWAPLLPAAPVPAPSVPSLQAATRPPVLPSPPPMELKLLVALGVSDKSSRVVGSRCLAKMSASPTADRQDILGRIDQTMDRWASSSLTTKRPVAWQEIDEASRILSMNDGKALSAAATRMRKIASQEAKRSVSSSRSAKLGQTPCGETSVAAHLFR